MRVWPLPYAVFVSCWFVVEMSLLVRDLVRRRTGRRDRNTRMLAGRVVDRLVGAVPILDLDQVDGEGVGLTVVVSSHRAPRTRWCRASEVV